MKKSIRKKICNKIHDDMKKTAFRLACEIRETTPTTLARILHIDGSMMRRYALGEYKPTPERAKRIAKILRMTVSELGWK